MSFLWSDALNRFVPALGPATGVAGRLYGQLYRDFSQGVPRTPVAAWGRVDSAAMERISPTVLRLPSLLNHQNVVNSTDPTFNQELGINNSADCGILWQGDGRVSQQRLHRGFALLDPCELHERELPGLGADTGHRPKACRLIFEMPR